MGWENLEDAFKELDRKEYQVIAKALGDYRDSLMTQRFTRRESMRLVETYSKFLYDMSLEEFILQKRREERKAFEEDLEHMLEDEEDDDEFDDS
jgi:hypothetical protein